MKLSDMLSKWPVAERPQMEADEAAERVVAAIEGGQLPASVDEALLAPPLPKTTDEGQTSGPRSQKPGNAGPVIAGVESKMSKDRTRDRTSFQELAKMATTPPPTATTSGPTSASASGSGPSAVVRGKEADSSDSGIVDLKMIASADPSGAQRAQSTPLAASGLFDDESAPAKPAMTAASAEAAATPAPSSAASAVEQAAPKTAKAALAKKPEEKKGGGGVVIVLGALVAAGAIAAGAFFFVKWQRAHHAAVATTNVTAPETTVAAQAPSAAPGTTATAAASVAEVDTAQETTTDENGRPMKSMGKYHAHRVPTGSGGGAASSAAPPTGTIDPKLVANIPTGPAGGNSGDLVSAMKAAAGGGTGMVGSGVQQQQQGPKYAPGSVPQRPSQGQVTGAIGLVLGGARACLSPGQPISHATITFQSDGSVKSVSVTGFAAGKPQEGCIKSALKKAHVDPFAEATYPATISIRPNN